MPTDPHGKRRKISQRRVAPPFKQESDEESQRRCHTGEYKAGLAGVFMIECFACMFAGHFISLAGSPSAVIIWLAIAMIITAPLAAKIGSMLAFKRHSTIVGTVTGSIAIFVIPVFPVLALIN